MIIPLTEKENEMTDTRKKFDGRAEEYEKGRPVYAEAFMDALFRNYGFSSTATVADIGSGTGKFAGQLLKHGFVVYGVEPNDEMRQKAAEGLSEYNGFHSVNGTEAQTGLLDQSVDFVTTAQAFHWFDVRMFQKECRRILKPDGQVFLIWNVRDMNDALNRDAYEVYRQFCPEFHGFSGGMKKDDIRIQEFFSGRYQYVEYENPLFYTEQTFISRSLSSSYSLTEKDAGYAEYLKALQSLFHKYEKSGMLTMGNHTVSYFGIPGK